MTSQGTAHGRFTRALASRNLRGAEMAARELGELALEDALGLCVLYLQCDPSRYERAAVRWIERLIAERPPSLEDVGLAVGALTELGNRNGNGAASMFSLKRLIRRPTTEATTTVVKRGCGSRSPHRGTEGVTPAT